MFQSERDEDVESFADGLEHDKVEWNSRQRIEHTKDLSARSLRRAVAVTWKIVICILLVHQAELTV